MVQAEATSASLASTRPHFNDVIANPPVFAVSFLLPGDTARSSNLSLLKLSHPLFRGRPRDLIIALHPPLERENLLITVYTL